MPRSMMWRSCSGCRTGPDAGAARSGQETDLCHVAGDRKESNRRDRMTRTASSVPPGCCPIIVASPSRTLCFEHSHHALVFKAVFQHNSGKRMVGCVGRVTEKGRHPPSSTIHLVGIIVAGPHDYLRQRPIIFIKIIHILRSNGGIAEQKETARIAAGACRWLPDLGSNQGPAD
jgi:hypothetical protein